MPDGEEHARVIATGTSKVTGRNFNLIVAFERANDEHGRRLAYTRIRSVPGGYHTKNSLTQFGH